MRWTCACGAVNQEAETFCSQCGAPNPGPATSPPSPASHEEDPTSKIAAPQKPSAAPPTEGVPPPPPAPSSKKKVIAIVSIAGAVVLLGLCLIGIVSAIAVPALLKGRENAKERQKQARAMEDMRKIAGVIQDYGETNGVYPNWGERKGGYNLRFLQELWAIVPASYGIRLQAHMTDPWKNPYKYAPNAKANQFIIVCQGSDNELQLTDVPDNHVGTHCFENDIVWHNDGFIQSPEGDQKKCK